MNAEIKVVAKDKITVAGDLTFATVNFLCQQANSLISANSSINMDFSRVERCDSAGVALLLEWLKYAKKHAFLLSFSNLVPQMQQIIQVCGLNEILNHGN